MLRNEDSKDFVKKECDAKIRVVVDKRKKKALTDYSDSTISVEVTTIKSYTAL